MLYGELKAALLLDKEANLAIERGNALSRRPVHDEQKLEVHYVG